GPSRQACVSRLEHGVLVSTAPAGVHLSRVRVRIDDHEKGAHRGRGRGGAQSQGAEREAARLAEAHRLMPASPAKPGRRSRASRSRAGGRSLIALVLLGFLLLATGVIARRTYGISQARRLRSLEQQRDALDASRVRLLAEIRDAASRARLMPLAQQRLHMYVPADSQVIILKRDK